MAEKNLKSMKKELAKHGVFYTDESLSSMLLSYIDNNPKTVYDPTCGQGNLLNPFADDIEKYGQELDAVELGKAQASLLAFQINLQIKKP
jgi:type I restriction-modification system DNA methylase subunit